MASPRVMLIRPGRVKVTPQGSRGPLPPKGGEGAPLPEAGDAIQQVMDAIRRLQEPDRQRALAEISLHFAASKGKTVHRDLAMWASAVHSRLAELQVTGYGPLLVKQQLASCWEAVADLAVALNLEKQPVQIRQAAYHLLAFVLLDEVRAMAAAVRAPLTLKMVVQQLPHLRALYEAQFPGYLSAGLGLLPVQSFVTTGPQDPAENI